MAINENHIQYAGVSIFVKDTPESKEALRLLTGAVPALGRGNKPPQVQSPFETETFNDLDFAYGLLQANYKLFARDLRHNPLGTPKDHARANVKTREIMGERITRIFVPIVDSYSRPVNIMTHDYLIPVVKALFGKDLKSINIKRASKWDRFENAETQNITFNQPAPRAFQLRP